MRAGVLISAISHVVLVLLALLGTPKLFDGTVQSITVDLVPSRRGPEVPQEPPKPEKDKPAAGTCRPSRARRNPRRPRRHNRPSRARRTAGRPRLKPQAPGPGRLRPRCQSPRSSIRPRSRCCSICPTRRAGISTPSSTTVANLSVDERAAFRARLRKCWKLPAAHRRQTTRVVLRIYLRRDARLAADPVLIEASASPTGRR